MPGNPDVVIIGLGPVGGVLAALCAQSGLSVTVIERDTEVYRLPRAVAMDHEVLRQVNLIGVAQDVLAASNPSEGYEFVNSRREILVARYQTGLTPTGYPFANMFHQPSFEAAVRRRLAELSNVQILLGSELVALEQNDDEVTASIKTPGGIESLATRYLIGCDGGRSFVRRWLETPMEDLEFDEPWLVVDVRLPNGVDTISTKGMQLCDPDRPTTSTQSGPGRHRWEFMLMPGEALDEVTDHEAIRKRLADWVDPKTVTIERSAVYRFHGLVAESWRANRVMIVGDAAHQMPPFLGQGLCSGVRDAFNLGWKLAAVAAGNASETLLDTVAFERAPHVKAITAAAIELGRLVCVTDPTAASERDRKFKADQAAGRPPPFPPMPEIHNGVLSDATAGKVFPEPFVPSRGTPPARLDDLAGYVPLLIVGKDFERSSETEVALKKILAASPDLRICKLGSEDPEFLTIQDPDNHVQEMLADQPALLVKPDRIVFGGGPLALLAQRWNDYINGVSTLRANPAASSDARVA